MPISHLRTDQVNVDIVPHLTVSYRQFLLGVPVVAQIAIQVKLLDDLQELGTGENLLIEALDALVSITCDRGSDKIRSYLLLFDENGGLGFIDGGEEHGHQDGNYHDSQGRPE